MYIACYKAKNEDNRDYDISYNVIKEENCFMIECYVDGSNKYSISSIGKCTVSSAENIAKCLAAESVRPVHLEDIISDMRL